MKWRTYDNWNTHGYYVMKGEVAMKWDKEGNALFSEKQVALKEYYPDEDYNYDPFWDDKD